MPLLVVAGWFMIEHHQTIASRVCAALVIITIVPSMGPTAHVGQSTGWTLPWQVLTYVPLLNQALPIRLAVYVSLILAVVAAMWLTSVRLNLWIRIGVTVLMIGSTFPNISIKLWHSQVQQLAIFFIDKALYHHYLHRGETVAILPFARWTESHRRKPECISGWRLAISRSPRRLIYGGQPCAPLSKKLKFSGLRNSGKLFSRVIMSAR